MSSDGGGGSHSGGSAISRSHNVGGGDSREAMVFVLILAAAGVLVFGIISLKVSLPLVLALFVLAVFLALFFPRYAEFKEYERGVVFRLGKFSRVVGPGFIFVFPRIDKYVTVDLRTQVLDIEPQEVITQDDLHLNIDAVVYYRIVDPKKAIVEIKDPTVAITNLMHSQIRNVVGKLLLEEVLEKTESINLDLYSTIKEAEAAWGITTLRVEVQSIELPKGLLAAFEKKREAKEFKERLQTEAEAKQISIELLDKVVKNVDSKTLAVLYIDALKKIADGKSNKIIFPLEFSRMATNLADGMKGSKQVDYEALVQSFLTSYQETKAKAFDESKPPLVENVSKSSGKKTKNK